MVRTCKTCRFWLQWLPDLGDCSEPISSFRDKWLRDEVEHEDHPGPMKEKTADQSCKNWQEREAA